MREIKFRIYSTSTKTWYFSINEKNMTLKDLQEGNSGTWKVMQFTGLQDKNGKEIYEGDIVKIVESIGGNFVDNIIREFEVIFHRFSFQLQPIPKSNHTVSLVLGEDTSIEIIGNIYENPELIDKPLANSGSQGNDALQALEDTGFYMGSI